MISRGRGGASARDRLRVAIIGGGLAGISAAVKLRRARIDSFTVFEQSAGPGGTWRDNRYPGCEVDVPSHAYSFSFMTYDWSGTHAKQPELEAYAQAVIERFDLSRHFRFGARVGTVRFVEEAAAYDVELDSGDVLRFDAVISCLGLLNVPQVPSFPGLEEFRGRSFHTSRWEPGHDLRNQRVAVIGTGSTGVQVAPSIAPDVAQLYVFQREPGWILPKLERDYTGAERARYRKLPVLQKLERALLFAKAEKRVHAFDAASTLQAEFRERCLSYIAESIDDPDLRSAVTPDYPWGCKRPVYSSSFYPCLNSPNVELVPHAVERVVGDGIVDATGTMREVDVIILATGFQPTKFLSTLEVVGVNGVSIHDVWRDDPRAFLGVTVTGFPNFFMCYGPNTNGGWSIIAQLERQGEVAARAIRSLRRRHVVDTRRIAMDRYVDWVDRSIHRRASATEAGCRNYYRSASGRNVTQWPFGHAHYYALTKLLPRVGFVGEIQRAPYRAPSEGEAANATQV